MIICDATAQQQLQYSTFFT